MSSREEAQDSPIRALSGDEAVPRIPAHSLDVVGVLGDGVNKLTRCDVVDVGRVVDRAGEDALAVGREAQVVNLLTRLGPVG